MDEGMNFAKMSQFYVSWILLSVSLCANIKCFAFYPTFDKRMRKFLATFLWLLNLPACAFQPPVSSHIACVP